MKKKIALVSFAVIIFLLMVFVLFKMRGREPKQDVQNEASPLTFTQSEVKEAQDLKLDKQDEIFSRDDMEAATNKKVSEGESGQWLFAEPR